MTAAQRSLIKATKKTLPVVVFIMLTTAMVALHLQPDDNATLPGGIAMALIISLLFYAAIRWDDVHKEEQREKEQLADVVGHSRDAIVIFQRSGHMLYANDAARRTYELHPEADLGNISWRTIGLTNQQWTDVGMHLDSGIPWDCEITLAARGSDSPCILLHVFSIERFQGHLGVIVCIGRDLTEQKRLQRDLMHSQKLAAVGELAAGVAHEINNPMAAINSQVGLAKDLLALSDDQQDRQQVVQCIEEASHQVDRVGHIVNSLLRFSRQQQHDQEPVEIGDTLAQAVKFAQSLPKLNGMTFDIAPTDLVACSDNEAIVQVLINLIINAADACDGRGTIQLQARTCDGGCVAIDVLDDGCGIEADHRDRVFEPFFTTKTAGRGTGLGLSISYGIAQSLQGSLELHARPEGGTRATLVLPEGQQAVMAG